jgi:hypothetical protein
VEFTAEFCRGLSHNLEVVNNPGLNQFAYSDAFRPLIPIDSGHLFRSIPAGHSD